MAADPPVGYADDFLDQILAIDSYTNLSIPDANSFHATSLSAAAASASRLNSAASHHQQQPLFPLGLSLDNGRTTAVNGRGAFAAQPERGSMNIGGLFQPFEHLQPHSLCHTAPQALQGPPTTSTAVTVQHPPSIRPRVRARRGQATDPHSIAERLRRERIAERMRALQELVPSCNKTDKAAMLDEILDYVKFLRLQVKVLSMSRLGGAGAVAQLVSDVPLQSVEVLSMSRLGGAGAVAQLVSDVPLQSVEGDMNESGLNQPAWETWSNDDTEREVAKLMEDDMGAAMQFLQSKALCIMPISLASLIYPTQQPDASNIVKPESGSPS